MEYTKDVIFPVHYAEKNNKEAKRKWKKRTSIFLEGKKIIFSIFTLVAFLIGMDLILINSFIQLFSTI